MAATRRGGATVHWQSSEQVAEAAGAEGVAGRQGGLAARRAYSFPAALLEQPPTLPPRLPGRKWGRGSIGAAAEAQQLVRVKNRYAAALDAAIDEEVVAAMLSVDLDEDHHIHREGGGSARELVLRARGQVAASAAVVARMMPKCETRKGSVQRQYFDIRQSERSRRIDDLVKLIRADDSHYSLHYDDDDEMVQSVAEVVDALEGDSARATIVNEASNMRHWLAFCEARGTKVFRDRPWVKGDSVHKLEMGIAVEALIYIYKHMQKRPGYKTPPKPASAVAVLRGVARAHRRMGYEFVDLTAVASAANKLTMKYMEINGYKSLLPKRAPPITNDEIERLLKEGEGAIPDGTALGPFPYRRDSKVGRSFRGVIATLAQCGFRGDEVALVNGKHFSGETCLSRASIRWKFGDGDWTSSPTREQLEGLRDGDMVMIIPPPSKADKFGTAWGNNPVYLAYRGAAKINAARELAQIELAEMASGEEARRKIPLFAGPNGAMLRRGDLAVMLRHALLVVGVATGCTQRM